MPDGSLTFASRRGCYAVALEKRLTAPERSVKVSGFTFVRNAIKYDFPVREAVASILPIVDEFVVNVGNSDDGTLELMRSMADPRIRIIESVWDESQRKDGVVFRQQTDIALDQCQGDWAFYLQADEVVHERELPRIRRAMEENLGRPEILALHFKYLHFFGDYRTVNPWFYRKEIRVVRNNGRIRSQGDAVGFYCLDDPAPINLVRGPASRYVRTGCHIYHYGWVKNPRVMLDKKMHQMSKHLEMTEDELRERLGRGRAGFEGKGLHVWDMVVADLTDEWAFHGYDFQKDFRGSHPKVMEERIRAFLPSVER
jgi:hypothetical protein